MGDVKMLLIEDDTRIGGLIVRGLRRDGHAVDVATTIEDGRWHASESAYDVLVLDVMLPDGDGFEFCRELRAAGNWTPVLLLTARDAVSDRVRGLDVGGDDYLVKPFAFAELSARLRALARRGASERPTVLEIGNLRVDPARRVATVDERDLVLTAKEFALLEHFARHPDLVMGRGQIIEEVWDWAFEGTPRIVDVYVRILRTKLGTGRHVPQLDTVRGSGYVLRGPAAGAAPRSRRARLAG